MQQFVVDKTHRPQIRLWRVGCTIEDLWRHIQRSAHNRIHNGILTVLQVLCEPEIADLTPPTLEQDIRRLQITMGDPMSRQIFEAIRDILEKPDRLLLIDLLPILEEVHEITLLTELRDDIHVIRGLVDVEQFDDVPVLHLLHYLDLTLNVLEVVVISEDLLIDDFDCHRFVVDDEPTQIHLGVGTLTQ